MTEFFIGLSKNESIVANEPIIMGKIKIGSFEESFSCPVTYWNGQQYLSQWKAALRRLIEGESKSALVTSMRDPDIANFVFWWVMYLDGNDIRIQNHVLFLDELAEPFDEKKLYAYIPDETTVEPGEPPPSEWRTTVQAVTVFLNSAGSPA